MTSAISVLAALALAGTAPAAALWEGGAGYEVVGGPTPVSAKVLAAGDVVWDVQVRPSRTARLKAAYAVPRALGGERIPAGAVLVGMTFLNTVKRGEAQAADLPDSFLGWCTENLACFREGASGGTEYKRPGENAFSPAPAPTLVEERGLVAPERDRVVLKAVDASGVVLSLQRGQTVSERRLRWGGRTHHPSLDGRTVVFRPAGPSRAEVAID